MMILRKVVMLLWIAKYIRSMQYSLDIYIQIFSFKWTHVHIHGCMQACNMHTHTQKTEREAAVQGHSHLLNSIIVILLLGTQCRIFVQEETMCSSCVKLERMNSWKLWHWLEWQQNPCMFAVFRKLCRNGWPTQQLWKQMVCSFS